MPLNKSVPAQPAQNTYTTLPSGKIISHVKTHSTTIQSRYFALCCHHHRLQNVGEATRITVPRVCRTLKQKRNMIDSSDEDQRAGRQRQWRYRFCQQRQQHEALRQARRSMPQTPPPHLITGNSERRPNHTHTPIWNDHYDGYTDTDNHTMRL